MSWGGDRYQCKIAEQPKSQSLKFSVSAKGSRDGTPKSKPNSPDARFDSTWSTLTHSFMDGHRSEPLSIENLLQRQREEKEAASKVCQFCLCAPSIMFTQTITAQVSDEGGTCQNRDS